MDAATVTRVDKSGSAKDIAALPDHLLKGIRLGAKAGVEAGRRRSALVGMGGSASAGEVLGSWLVAERGIRLPVVRDAVLPAWIQRGDFVIVVSYSGNTRETLDAFEQARDRKCEIVGVSSGGTLRDRCEKADLPHLLVPSGLMPREAFGYVFGALAALYGPATPSKVEAAAEAVRMQGKTWKPSVATQKNAAKKLAGKIKGRTPIVYATPTYAPIARRWQTQFNENAKVLAWASVLPEADHNELVGWDGDSAAKRFAPILLRDAEEHGEHAVMFDATRDLIKRKTKVEEIRAEGPTLLARMLTTLHLGDWTSLYLAVARNVDPTPVAVIGKLKARLAKGG